MAGPFGVDPFGVAGRVAAQKPPANQAQADLRKGGFLFAEQQRQNRAARAAAALGNQNQPQANPSRGTANPLTRDQQFGLAVNQALLPNQALGRVVRESAAAAPGPSTGRIAKNAANLGLGVLGTDVGHVGFALTHPIARLQEKGPFAPTTFAVVGGKRVPVHGTAGFPWPGSGKGVANEVAKLLPEKVVVRSTDEAAQHVAAAAKAAKDRGFGVPPPEAPKVGRGTVTPETAGELGGKVRNALRGGPTPGVTGSVVGAKSLRESQEALRSPERAARASKAAEAMDNIGGLEGHHAALSALKGELPSVHFGGFQQMDSDSILGMINHAQQHPDLLPYEKIRTVEAITKAVAGKVPTASEQKLLERAFGIQVAGSVAKASGWRDKIGRSLADVLNLPRALEASFDLSAPFRQGLIAGVSHPVIFSKNLWPMVKAAGSEKVYKGIMDGIASRPTFPLMDKAGLAITNVHGHALSDREEMFMTRLVGKIPLMRGSERAYTGFLNKTRADIFDHLVQQAAEQGRSLEDPKLVKDIARFVNTATGRGDLGRLAPAAVALNTTLFSPRLLASRLNMISPRYYATLDPFARREALKAAAGLVLTMGSVLEMARMAGARVNSDPRNADFGKIRIGNTRVDIAGGFQQPIRLLAQEASGKIVSSTTGKTLTLGPSGPGKLSRWDIAERFALSKLAPVPSIASDVLHGSNFIGQPITAKGEASSHLIPLLWQDIYSLYQSGGVPAAGAGVIPGLFGVGLQTYGNNSPSKKTKEPGTDPFNAGAGSSAVDPFHVGG